MKIKMILAPIFLLTVAFSNVGLAQDAPKQKPKKTLAKAAKSKWCCMMEADEGEEILMLNKKPICLKSKKAPKSSAKSKLTKKFVKTCKAKEGKWIKQ